MRNTVAKRLRKEALTEMLGDGVPKRDLVMGRSSVINSPSSVRALYLQLKAAWKNLPTSSPALVATRLRKRSGFYRPQLLRVGLAWIAKPLKLIRRTFPGTTSVAIGHQEPVYIPSAVASLAWDWARRGQGHKITALARRYA